MHPLRRTGVGGRFFLAYRRSAEPLRWVGAGCPHRHTAQAHEAEAALVVMWY